MDKRRHPRFIKRLTATFFVDHERFRGISSDLSERGLFIRTNRGLAANTPIDIELLLPNSKVSFLRGIVRRTVRRPISSMKNGMGIEIMEGDETFTNFVKSVVGGNKTAMPEKDGEPELRTISFSEHKARQKESASMTHERRRHKRLKVGHLKIDSEMPSAGGIRILNISMSGVLLKAGSRMEIGRKYAVRMEYKDKVLPAEAHVVWSLLLESMEDADGDIKPIYLAGMKFTDVSGKEIKEIVNLIESDTEAEKNQPGDAGVRHEEFICRSHDGLPKVHSAKGQECVERKHGTGQFAEFTVEIENLYDRYEQETLTYYGILDICDFAGAEEVRKAYYKKAKELHPDRHFYLSPAMKEKLNFLFAYLTEAYKTLVDPANKEKYDRSLLAKERPASGKESAHREFERGKLEFWNGNFLQAERFLQKALYLDAHSSKYYYFYAKTLLKLGKPQDAEKAIRKAINIDPSRPDYLTEAGCIYSALGLSHRARESFETALRFQPANIRAQEGIAGLKDKKSGGTIPQNIYNSIKAFIR
jgi:tetratricopeptide (TPR) repeat protein